MPLKLNVGLSKKIGQPDYGSLGASCNVEIELDGALLQSDLDTFHRRVRDVFVACRQAVNDELTRRQRREGSEGDLTNGNAPTDGAQTNGHGNGNGHGPSTARRATASQVRAIHAIADRQQVDLVRELRTRFGAEQAEDLSITEASVLIDELKGVGNDAGGHR